MIEVRKARIEDLEKIKSVVKSAFYREGKNETFNEWEFVERVTKDKGYVQELCLLAVTPKYQRIGIGKKLVERGLKQARVLGYEWVALTGGDYYFQFGFEPALKYNIILSEDNPENEYLKIVFLNEAIKYEVKGTIRFCDSFYNERGELL